MNWRLFIVAITNIALFAVGIEIVFACADFTTSFTYPSFFQNNITGKPQYKPFSYFDYTRLYDDWVSELPEDNELPDGNIDEWYRYCNKKVKKADIDSFLNHFSEEDVQGLSDKDVDLPAHVRSNGFSRFLSAKANRELLDYLLFAKKCEQFGNWDNRFWDDDGYSFRKSRFDTTQLWSLMLHGSISSLKTQNDYLKWRYAYQAIRIAFYTRHYNEVLNIYNKMIGKRTAMNIMYPRCLSLKAGALYYTGQMEQSAYLYSRVFDLSDDMKKSAYQSFLMATHGIKTSDLMPLCKNNHERAVLVVMDGLFEKHGEEFEGLQRMEKASYLDPNIKGLDVIMTREINKAEQRYLYQRELIERRLEDWWGSTYPMSSALYYILPEAAAAKKEWKVQKARYAGYLNKLNRFAQKMAREPQMTDRSFWLLSASYIYFMLDEFKESKTFLDLAGHEQMNHHEREVYDIINILCIVNGNEKITPETEAQLLPGMQGVEKRDEESYRVSKRYYNAQRYSGFNSISKIYTGLLGSVLKDKYMQQKDTVKALYCLARAEHGYESRDFYVDKYFTDIPGTLLEKMSMGKLHEVQEFVNKKDKTGFEKWLTDKTPYPLPVLKEIEGTKYIREMKFEQAVLVLREVPESVLSKTVLPDMTVGHLQDDHRWNASDSANTYNKLRFAKKMLELERKVERDPGNSRVAYLYANGLYSMSYYGRAHQVYDYYLCTFDKYAYFTSAGRNRLPAFEQEYYGVSKALKYYLLAYSNTADREMKARCLFMAAKCWQKNAPLRKGDRDVYSSLDYEENSLRNPYFARLEKEYRSTQLFSNAYSSCSFLRDYVAQSK